MEKDTKTFDRKKIPSANKEKNPDLMPKSDIVDNLQVTCFEIARDYISQLEDPQEIKENNGLFVDMLKEIYNQHLKYILDNNNGVNNRYDYKILDKIFNIYTKLCYTYKQNKRPNILEFTLFSNISRQSLYNAFYGNTRKLSDNDLQMVKKWFTECENCLVNGSSVFDIFLLKSQYRYNDNLSPIPIESQGSPLSVSDLPDLSNGVAKIATNGDIEPQKEG